MASLFLIITQFFFTGNVWKTRHKKNCRTRYVRQFSYIPFLILDWQFKINIFSFFDRNNYLSMFYSHCCTFYIHFRSNCSFFCRCFLNRYFFCILFDSFYVVYSKWTERITCLCKFCSQYLLDCKTAIQI